MILYIRLTILPKKQAASGIFLPFPKKILLYGNMLKAGWKAARGGRSDDIGGKSPSAFAYVFMKNVLVRP
jgi:hypothetical protein